MNIKMKLALALAVAGALALVGAMQGSASHGASPYKVAWIYVGPHNDGGWSQAHDQGRLYVQKMLGSKVQTTYKENIAVGAQFNQTVQSLNAQGYKLIFATSYGYLTKAFVAEVPERALRAGDGNGSGEEPVRVLRRAPRTRSSSPAWRQGRRARPASSGTSLPFPIPEVIRHANAFALGAQVDASGRDRQPRLDELLVRSGEGEEGGPEPRRRRCRRGRAERRQPGGRRVLRVGEGAVGRLRLRRQEVRAEVVADRLGLQLGPVLPEARPGGHERHLEVGLLLRHDQGRLHEARPVRARRHRGDEGEDRRVPEEARQRVVLRVHRARSTTRAASCA